MNNKKLAIITDSSCDLPKKYIEENGIFIIPLQINMPDGKTYLDGITISPEEIYSKMPAIIPTTSQPSPNDVLQLFEKVKSQGYKEAIVIAISSAMSGTYEVIKLSIKEEKELVVHSFDSKRLSMALGMLIVQAVELNNSGKTASEILSILEKSSDLTNGFFCIPTLRYLLKGGRIGKVIGTIGTLLGIIPVISINSEGQYYSVMKTLNYGVSIKKMVQRVKEIIKDKLADIAILQGDAKEKAKEVFDMFKNNKGIRNRFMCNVSPAMGVHSGPGLVGVVYRIIT